MSASAQAQQIILPAVRLAGWSFYLGDQTDTDKRRLFADLDPDEKKVGASLRSYFRRDFDPRLVSPGYLRSVEVLEDCTPRLLLEALKEHGWADLSPDLIDAAVRMNGADDALDGIYAFVDCNPGPSIVSITYTGDIPDVKWANMDHGTIPAGSSFLVFGKK